MITASQNSYNFIHIAALSLIFAAIYGISWLVARNKGKTPKADFMDIVILVLSSAGLVVSVEILNILVLKENPDYGDFAGKSLPIFLGALAIMWTSAKEIIRAIRFR